ncbi:tetratricopeptide (TPR) repeat protein [Variovorax boronicumulans]|uniref:hypothetical protein n=1 Tax=Variovorax boronicumulans TaxID=436515 RepID=UPI002780DAC7|nr:hypothetical protein [Variovorax boronicumulans]MDQ0014217.1 tetratricopeptide (TPR) repeat protein [Variovorax boronicumulans]
MTNEFMKSSLLAKFALICSMLAPWLAVATDEVVFRDKAGRVLKKSDLAEANGNFTWELASTTLVSEAAKKEHALGRAAGQRGDHRTALAHFAAASKMAPAWPYPVYDAAFTFLLQKEFDTAYEYYRRVDQMAPRGFFTAKTAVHALRMELTRELPSGTYLSYVALEWETDKQKVRQVAQAMTRVTPGFAPAWKTAAMLEDDLGRRAALLESGLKARPDEETRGFLLLNKALVLHEQNRTSEAKAILGELALAPTSPRDVEALAKRTLAQLAQR